MIYFYSGTPGSGKSLHVAKDIYWKLHKPDCVIANFEINRDLFINKKGKNTMKGTFIFIENYFLNPDFLMKYARAFFRRDKKGRIVEGQAFLIIDECQMMFNAREWNAVGRNHWTKFFTQHRKFGFDIILISQFDRLVDRQIRSLIEYEVKHRKLNNYKLMGKIMGLLGGGSMFVAINYWYGVREKIGTDYYTAKKRYIQFYDSYKIFN